MLPVGGGRRWAAGHGAENGSAVTAAPGAPGYRGDAGWKRYGGAQPGPRDLPSPVPAFPQLARPVAAAALALWPQTCATHLITRRRRRAPGAATVENAPRSAMQPVCPTPSVLLRTPGGAVGSRAACKFGQARRRTWTGRAEAQPWSSGRASDLRFGWGRSWSSNPQAPGPQPGALASRAAPTIAAAPVRRAQRTSCRGVRAKRSRNRHGLTPATRSERFLAAGADSARRAPVAATSPPRAGRRGAAAVGGAGARLGHREPASR